MENVFEIFGINSGRLFRPNGTDILFGGDPYFAFNICLEPIGGGVQIGLLLSSGNSVNTRAVKTHFQKL